MKISDLIRYLEYRIDCVQSFLRDMYAINSDDIEVVKAEIQLELLSELLNVCYENK